VIRSMDAKTFKVTTVWGTSSGGSTDGPVKTAEFSEPFDVIQSADGAFYYVLDAGNNMVRQICKKTWIVKTIAGSGTRGSKDGTCTKAQMRTPRGFAIFNQHKILIADSGNDVVRMVYTKYLRTAPIGGVKPEYFGEVFDDDPHATFGNMCSFPMGQTQHVLDETVVTVTRPPKNTTN